MQASSQGLISDASSKKKLIKIDPEVHKELNDIGLRGESFSDIIHRLVKEHKEKERAQKK
jgi:predicted CopG family antitoxin